ncbi:MAG TPA: hypothetical protein VN633_18800 [Bryobacteraceae bacterium]|nr:hypothetical protein [Bryobacteraceae bacterium]
MTKPVLVSLTACLLTGATAFAAPKTWTGKITDSMCDKDHSMMAEGGKMPDAKKCTLACVKGGSKFVFVSKGKVYALANQDMPELQTFAGDNVRLTGELQPDGKTIKADQLQAAK